ncbi:TerC family protein [Clostridium acetobutylicum]|uniref:Membrane protein, TerC homolog n=1 Tax=Clostridium acetobutylicum (strain ATCC 824 / DSM 792 / JCM 1419 / IAM 19013 / LMG 5710 / NBRC 13948 / NRRL B-527 / VKM B-1787 / 2291 / W) TaxID=272562 RepID=Q97K80_CLOAB|nr:TerC family protein [Clostridium acetobutylicum]AAK79015.1 Membrane protein, TerC homolog [Clostridium acetobutylicum ATCC 824]
MDNLIPIFLGALQITLLDVVLSGDNIGVIALATKDLPKTLAKKASFIGVVAAVTLRIIFACLITYILMIQWLPIKLVGGIILVKITWDFIKPHEESSNKAVHNSKKMLAAIQSIILADFTMSLDNVLAIAAAAKGHIGLIVFGLILNIPIIFWGSQYVATLMKKYKIVIYIGGAILAHTAFSMIFEDRLIKNIVPHSLGIFLPYAFAALTLLYGFIILSFSSSTKRSEKSQDECAITKK